MHIQLSENEPLKNHTRFRIGGPARYFITASSTEEVINGIKFAQARQLKLFVLGNGSNVLFDDAGFNGLVLKLTEGLYEVHPEQNRVKVFAGCTIGRIVKELAAQNQGGLEFLANIPGSIGGMIYGNAGCYGKSIKDVLFEVRFYDQQAHELRSVHASELEFDYRHSEFKEKKHWIICEASLFTTARSQSEIEEEISAELNVRLKKHPHNAYCAGSFFKNQPDYPAWQIITDAGLANSRVGDAMLSPMHPNFVVNHGNATSAEVIALMREIQAKVKARLNIQLLPEVIIVDYDGNIIQT